MTENPNETKITQKAIDALEKYVTEYDGQWVSFYQWISIEDELPELNKTVLVYACNMATDRHYMVTMGSLIEESSNFWLIFSVTSDKKVHMVKGTVNHWMPLPLSPGHEYIDKS